MRTHTHLLGVLLPSRLVLRVRHISEVVHLRLTSDRGLVQRGVEGVLVDGGGAVEVELRVPPQGLLPAAVAVAVAAAEAAGAAGVRGASCAIMEKTIRIKRGGREEGKSKRRHVNRNAVFF